MSRESMLIVIGALLMLSPFFSLALGLLVSLVGLSLRLRKKRRQLAHEASHPALS